MIATGLDYSAGRLSGASIRAAGHKFVNRYLWFPGQGHAYLTADEYRDLSNNGVEVHAIYEQNTNDPAGGWNSGVAMARQAVQSAQAVGLPVGRTVFMCADAWLSTHGIPIATAMSFLDGARSILRAAGYMTGAYGFQDFVYAAQDSGRADRFWLCGAESGVRPGIHMYQWNNGSVRVSGLTCDLNKQYISMFEGAPGGGGVGGDTMSAADAWNGFSQALQAAAASVAAGAPDDVAKSLQAILAPTASAWNGVAQMFAAAADSVEAGAPDEVARALRGLLPAGGNVQIDYAQLAAALGPVFADQVSTMTADKLANRLKD